MPFPTTGTLSGEGEEEDGGGLADGDVHDDAVPRHGGLDPGLRGRHPDAAGGPDRSNADDARLAVHQAVREGHSGVGGAHDPHPGDDRRVAEGAGAVALSRPDLLVRGHHEADARGGADVPGRRQ